MTRLLHQRRVMGNCLLTLLEVGSRRTAPPAPDPPSPLPRVEVGPTDLAVETRCYDDGDVGLEVWAGDPGAPGEGWVVVFDGNLETDVRGFDSGTATSSTFHIAAPPGTYHVRAEAHHDSRGLVDAVRFVFPKNDELAGHDV
jgi:hypothetical protein